MIIISLIKMRNLVASLFAIVLLSGYTELSGQITITEDSVEFGKFGIVHLYKPNVAPTEVVFFVSEMPAGNTESLIWRSNLLKRERW